MKARVKKAYFDRLGLHKVGAIVEVSDIKKMNSLVEPLEEVKAEETETVTVEKPKKKAGKKKG